MHMYIYEVRKYILLPKSGSSMAWHHHVISFCSIALLFMLFQRVFGVEHHVLQVQKWRHQGSIV